MTTIRWMIGLTAVMLASVVHADRGLDAVAGRALFERNWIAAPSSTDASDGLGPLFNARACSGCHAGGGGARWSGEKFKGAVVRFGSRDGAPDPTLGLQLQTDAVPQVKPEGAVARMWPKLRLSLDGVALGSGINSGVRLAPGLHGRARFDDVPDAEILLREDPGDRDGDGISGRANRVAGDIGRFGWKAAHATLSQQIAHAFAIDIGLSSPLQPRPSGDCTAWQSACLGAFSGESVLLDGREVSSQMIDLVGLYLRSLKPRVATEKMPGAAIFADVGCARCHVPAMKDKSGDDVPTFSDLLLHDMGPVLDDGVGESGVSSGEWRTPSLLGLAPPGVRRRYLHDGRAATITAAIDAHGGEAQDSRDRYVKLGLRDRQRLMDYLKGL